jgi:7-cyano-7-deazaguanine reductase
MKSANLIQAPLGKKSAYCDQYDPSLLFALSRQSKRDEIGITAVLPFQGHDIWNAFELSWLTQKGKPVVALAEIIFPCESPYLIESKSLKLYFNSFNQSAFADKHEVENIMMRDLSQAAGKPVSVNISLLSEARLTIQPQFTGILLDDLDIACDVYTPQPAFLMTENHIVTETLCSNLLKSNCLVTYQPDWGSVQITYTGNRIDHAGLLKYLVSFRHHNEFHEQCVERIFMDIMQQCAPEKLCVYARYTRRGGLDINPYRANYSVDFPNYRLARQ